MATLQIKNKYQVSFVKLIRESDKEGGIPDIIQVDGREAWEILNEMRAVGYKGFEIVPTDEYDPQFILKASEEKLTREQAEDLVTRWWKKEFRVNFKNNNDRIPVVVMSTPKKKTSHPTPPVTPKPGVDKGNEKSDNDETDD